MNQNHILLIDDDKDTVFLYKTLARNSGFGAHFTAQTSGKAALEYLQTADPFPDVLIVDINMYGMSGFEFVSAFEKEFYPQHPETLVIILSSSVRESDRKKALAFNSVREFISKPLTNASFLELFTDKLQQIHGDNS